MRTQHKVPRLRSAAPHFARDDKAGVSVRTVAYYCRQLFAAATVAGRCCCLVSWRRLPGSDEGAHEFFVGFAGEGVYVEALSGQEFAGILDAVDAGGFDIDV